MVQAVGGGRVRAEQRKEISAKEILWVKTCNGKADGDFEEVKGQEPLV